MSHPVSKSVRRMLCASTIAMCLTGFVTVGTRAADSKPGGERKLLVLGNSISRRTADPALHWNHESGMAASSESADYVHLLAKLLGRADPVVLGFAGVERDPHANEGLIDALADRSDDMTDVVVQIGDNSVSGSPDFAYAYERILNSTKHRHALVCVSTWWRDPVKDQVIEAACTRHAGRYVTIGDVSADPRNSDHRSGPQYTDPGVNAHPHDWSMAVIAGRIASALRQ